jgi:hypothetical protein
MKKIIISNVLFIFCFVVTSTHSQPLPLNCRSGFDGTVRAVLKPGQKKPVYNLTLTLDEIAETKYDNAQSHQKVKVPYYILDKSNVSTVIERIIPQIRIPFYSAPNSGDIRQVIPVLFGTPLVF